MIDLDSIKEGMAVVASDGTQVGEVDGVETGMGAPGDARIKLTRDASPDGMHHHVPLTEVARVDGQVHLSRSADEVRSGWEGAGAASVAALGVAGEARSGATAATDHSARAANVEGRNEAWLPWILGALALVGLLIFGVRSCDSAEPAAVAPTNTNAVDGAT